jgi:protein-tyrosine phosphatase
MRTSLTHPLQIKSLPVSGGTLGLTICPGKQGDSVYGAPWARDLHTDLLAVKEWGGSLVVTLMERHEFQLLGVEQLPDRVAAFGMDWLHLPIRDVDIPNAAFMAEWPAVRVGLLSRLVAGEKILVHCRGGLGRTGIIAAMILIDTGSTASKAIASVRAVRPGAIETTAQENFVRTYRS